MRISTVVANARKKEFEVMVADNNYSFPYVKLRLTPSSEDPVSDAYPDPELGNEAFTYHLKSGAEDTVHLDAVMEVNMDPDYLRDLMLHRLSVAAMSGLQESGLGRRQVARQLGTSPAQLYRLLDPENRTKSLGQMLYLLHIVNRQVDLVVSSKKLPQIKKPESFQIFRDKGGSYRFRLKKADGGVALLSTKYPSKTRCLRAIQRVRNYAVHDACFERKRSASGKYLFWMVARNHHVIAKSPAFQSPARRDSALSFVRKKAADLEIEELCD